MELIFEISGGYNAGVNRFSMEVSHSDSVPQIKQKIQELTRIPIFRQTLRFNGDILDDNFNLRHSQIVDGSIIHIHLLQHILNKIVRDCGRLLSPPSSDQTQTQPRAAVGNQPSTAILPQYPTGAGLRIILHQNTPSSSSRSVITPAGLVRSGYMVYCS